MMAGTSMNLNTEVLFGAAVKRRFLPRCDRHPLARSKLLAKQRTDAEVGAGVRARALRDERHGASPHHRQVSAHQRLPISPSSLSLRTTRGQPLLTARA